MVTAHEFLADFTLLWIGTSAPAYYFIGLLYLQLGRFQESIATLKQALRLRPEEPP